MECQSPWWSNIVTWCLVFGGWYVVHKTTLSRERRKERREIASTVINELRQIETDAMKFHAAPSFNSQTFNDLKIQIERLIKKIQRDPLCDLELPLSYMVKLRKSITLKNVEPTLFQSQSPASEILRDIRIAIDDLIEVIEDKRNSEWR